MRRVLPWLIGVALLTVPLIAWASGMGMSGCHCPFPCPWR
jgi:hypothetical protein